MHPSVVLLYAPVNTGGVTSTIQLTVLATVDVLLQASIAVNVLICDLLQPVLVTGPSFCVTVGIPQASLAVAEPSAVVIAAGVGLQPKFCGG